MSLKVLQGSRGGGEKAMDLVDPWASRSYWIDDRCQAGCPPELLSHGDCFWESWVQVALSRLAGGWAGPRVP